MGKTSQAIAEIYVSQEAQSVCPGYLAEDQSRNYHEYWLASAIAFLKEHQISNMLLCQSFSDKSRGLRVGFMCGFFACLDWVFFRERGTFCLLSARLVGLERVSLLW